MNAAEHLAEADRLIALADRLASKHTDREGRVILAGESAADLTALSALATAHATIAIALEAEQARGDRNTV
jgi:hypothetical protein